MGWLTQILGRLGGFFSKVQAPVIQRLETAIPAVTNYARELYKAGAKKGSEIIAGLRSNPQVVESSSRALVPYNRLTAFLRANKGKLALGSAAGAGATGYFAFFDDFPDSLPPSALSEGAVVAKDLIENGIVDGARNILVGALEKEFRLSDGEAENLLFSKSQAYLSNIQELSRTSTDAGQAAKDLVMIKEVIEGSNLAVNSPVDYMILLSLLAPKRVEKVLETFNFSDEFGPVLVPLFIMLPGLLDGMFKTSNVRSSIEGTVPFGALAQSSTAGSFSNGGMVCSVDDLRTWVPKIRRLEELTGLSGMNRHGVPLLAEYLELLSQVTPEIVSRFYEARSVYVD